MPTYKPRFRLQEHTNCTCYVYNWFSHNKALGAELATFPPQRIHKYYITKRANRWVTRYRHAKNCSSKFTSLMQKNFFCLKLIRNSALPHCHVKRICASCHKIHIGRRIYVCAHVCSCHRRGETPFHVQRLIMSEACALDPLLWHRAYQNTLRPQLRDI